MSDESQVKIISPENIDELPDEIREKIAAAMGIDTKNKNVASTIGSLIASVFLSMSESEHALVKSGFEKFGEEIVMRDMPDLAVMASIPIDDARNYKFGDDTSHVISMCLASGIEMMVDYLENGPGAMQRASNIEKAMMIKSNSDRWHDLYNTGRIETDMYTNAAYPFMDACLKAAYANTMEGYLMHLESCSKGMFQSCAKYVFETSKKLWTKNTESVLHGLHEDVSDYDIEETNRRCLEKAEAFLKTMASAMWLGDAFIDAHADKFSQSVKKLARVLSFLILEKSSYGVLIAGQHLHNAYVTAGMAKIRGAISKEDMLTHMQHGITEMAGSQMPSLDLKLAAKCAGAVVANIYDNASEEIRSKAAMDQPEMAAMVAMAAKYPEEIMKAICPQASGIVANRYRDIRYRLTPSADILSSMSRTNKERKSFNV